MKRFFTALAAFGMVAALGAPATAAELKGSGTIKVKHIITTETGAGQQYVRKDLVTKRLTTMRGNPKLQFLANEYAGFVWVGEIDVDFGDNAYNTESSGSADFGNGSLSGDGGALAADTVNIETKNLYLHFDIPETPVSIRAGITGTVDSFDFIISGTDTAGLRALVDLGDTKVNVDWMRWWDKTDTSIVDDVDFYMLTVRQKLGGASVGGALYYLKDGSGDVNGSNGGVLQKGLTTRGSLGYLTANAATGFAPIIPMTITDPDDGTVYDLHYSLDSYYLGLFGNVMAGPVKIEAWALYNFGTVDFAVQEKGGNANDTDSSDIKAFALDLRATGTIADISVSGEVIYVSGDDTPMMDGGDFGLITADQYQLAGAFYYKHGMMILMNDSDDINNHQALVQDVANIWESTYLGTMGAFLNARMKLPMNLSGKVALGYVASANDRLVNGNSAMGTELNATITYTPAPGLTLSLNGAYAWTGDFYEVSKSESTKYNAKYGSVLGMVGENKDPDDVFYASLVARLAM